MLKITTIHRRHLTASIKIITNGLVSRSERIFKNACTSRQYCTKPDASLFNAYRLNMHPTNIGAMHLLNNKPYQRLVLLSKKKAEDSLVHAVSSSKAQDPRSILSTKLTYYNHNMEVALINMEQLERISVSKECFDSIKKFNNLYFLGMLRFDTDSPADLFIVPMHTIVYRDNKYQIDKQKVDSLFKTESALEIMKKILAQVNNESEAKNSPQITARDVNSSIKYLAANDKVTFEGLKRVEQLNIFESMRSNDGIFIQPTPEQEKDAKEAEKLEPVTEVVVPSTKKQWRKTYDSAKYPHQFEQPIGSKLGKELQEKISKDYQTKAEMAMNEIRSELIGRVAFAAYNDRHYTLRDVDFLRVPTSSFLIRGRAPSLIYETFHRHYMARFDDSKEEQESPLIHFDQPMLLPLEDVRSNLPILIYKFMKSLMPASSSEQLNNWLLYTFSSPESFMLYKERGLAITDTGERKRAHTIFPELTEIYPKRISPEMLYFGEFLKDFLNSFGFWQKMPKVQEWFGINYSDKSLLKKIFIHNSFLGGFETGTKLAQFGDMLLYLMTVQITFSRSFSGPNTRIKNFAEYKEQLISARKLWNLSNSLNLIQFAFLGTKLPKDDHSFIAQINMDLMCRVFGSIFVEQGVEKGLQTLLDFMKKQFNFLKDYNLKITLDIPTKSSATLDPTIDSAEKLLNYQFPGKSKGKIVHVLTNQSSYESQILEWLGDSVLKLAVATYHIDSIHDEKLAAMFDIGNSNSFLATVMQEVFDYKVTSMKTLKNSADAFEMIVAILYLEVGFEGTEKFIHAVMDKYKSKVAEWSDQLVNPSIQLPEQHTFLSAMENGSRNQLSPKAKKSAKILHSKDDNKTAV